MNSKIYLEVKSDVNDNKVNVTLETYVTLFVFRYVLSPPINVTIILVKTFCDDDSESISIDVSSMKLSLIQWNNEDFQQEVASLFKLPVLINDKCVIAGICGVCRGFLKLVNRTDTKQLLGFKEGCLQAPLEISTWTKFCEIDFIECTKNMLKMSEKHFAIEKQPFELPDEFGIFEKHLSLPVRMHNIYKVARNLSKEKKAQSVTIEQQFQGLNIETRLKLPRKNKHRKSKAKPNLSEIPCSIPMHQLDIPHIFAEGQDIHLVDVILYSCYFLILEALPNKTALLQCLPLTSKWINALTAAQTENFKMSGSLLIAEKLNLINDITYKCPSKEFKSLYKSDPQRYNPKNRIFTKQSDIDLSLDKVNALNIEIASLPMTNTKKINWSSIPYEASPEGGQLPMKRLERKKQQLECLAQWVIEISKPGDRIVDFCSGAGHLGILLAQQLPECQVILLENKEESLMRAKQRVDLLQLTNVLFFQCNLDYFVGKFNIGCSLHACGVATDIVLSHCLERKASFVCCPCCYGGIHAVPHIQYPRSELYKVQGTLLESEYMNIAHCADQAHDINKGQCNLTKSEQGQFCMDVVDTDRKLMAEQYGYEVQLMRLTPEDCTPKNRLLIGMFTRKDTSF